MPRTSAYPDNDDDYVDIRDVIKRIENLAGDCGDAAAQVFYELSNEGWKGLPEADRKQLITKHAEDEGFVLELEALEVLQGLLESLKGYGGDHQHEGDSYPITLIRDSYFQDYARETAEDIGAINKDAAWPTGHIDWEAAANALKMDYSAVEWDGVIYWYR